MHPEDILKNYFQAWLDNDIEVINQTFSDNIIYSECYGPEYHGISQIRLWFTEWNKKGKVLEWNIKRFFHQDNTNDFNYTVLPPNIYFYHKKQMKSEILSPIPSAFSSFFQTSKNPETMRFRGNFMLGQIY